MDTLFIIEQTLIVQLYFESNSSVVRTRRAFRSNIGNKNHPSPCCIRLIVPKFKALGTVADRQHPGRSRTLKNIDNIKFACQDVTHNPRKSVRRSEELQISKPCLWRILREDLMRYLYKIQLVQEIGQNDYEKRLHFTQTFVEIFQEGGKICSMFMTD